MYKPFFCRRVTSGVELPDYRVISDSEFISKCVGIGYTKGYATSRLDGKSLGQVFSLNLSPAQSNWFKSSI